jgi:hypothetical protein
MPARAARSHTHQGVPISPGLLGITVVVTVWLYTRKEEKFIFKVLRTTRIG